MKIDVLRIPEYTVAVRCELEFVITRFESRNMEHESR